MRLPEGSKTTPQTSEPSCWGPVRRSSGETARSDGDQADLHVAAVLAHQHVAARRDRHVVHRVQRRVLRQLAVEQHVDQVLARVVGPHLLVALGREVTDAAPVPDALAAGEHRGRRAPGCGSARAARSGRGPRVQRTRRARRDGGHLQQPAGQVREARRGEAVEAPVGPVLGQVEAAADGVDRDGLVREDAQRRAGLRGQAPAGVALPDHAVVGLLAGQPRAPRRRAAAAVHVGVAQDPVGRRGSPRRGRSGWPRCRRRWRPPTPSW